MNKKELRTDIKEKMASLSKEERLNKSSTIQDKLFQFRGWKDANVIGITISVGNEIDTYEIISHAWNEGKTIVVPKCHSKTKELTFHKITSFEDLEDSFYGLKEPNLKKINQIDPLIINLLLVPGLLFDRNGYRIGYGGGYYDRFLSGKNIETCSLAYDVQLKEQLPHDSYDIPVSSIITEKEFIDV